MSDTQQKFDRWNMRMAILTIALLAFGATLVVAGWSAAGAAFICGSLGINTAMFSYYKFGPGSP